MDTSKKDGALTFCEGCSLIMVGFQSNKGVFLKLVSLMLMTESLHNLAHICTLHGAFMQTKLKPDCVLYFSHLISKGLPSSWFRNMSLRVIPNLRHVPTEDEDQRVSLVHSGTKVKGVTVVLQFPK